MNWHDGLIVIWQLHGYGFKSCRAQIKLYIFLFMVESVSEKGAKKEE